jgi:type IV pilus assembly protein PilC
MAEFRCRLANSNGEIVAGAYSSASEAELRHRLTEQGFYVYSIQEQGKWLALGRGGSAKKIKPAEFMVFNQQFAALVRSGLPILKSLGLLSQLIANPHFRDILADIANRVKSGELLSSAFEAQGIFPKVYTASLYAGEKSGSLEEVVRRYIEFQKTVIFMRTKIRGAMTYPAIVLVLMVSMVSYLMVGVVPRYAEFYTGMGQTLPLPTQMLIAISTAIRSQLIAGLVGLATGWLGWQFWVKTDRGKLWLDGVKFKLPLFGEVWNKFSFAQLSRTLSILLAGGIPLLNSLEIVADSTGNVKVTGTIQQAIRAVREGQSLSSSLAASDVVPYLAIEMIQVGETTGSLSEMLRHIADFYDEEVMTRLNQLFTYVEPVLLVILASIVTFVLVSLYLPIFQLAGMMGS